MANPSSPEVYDAGPPYSILDGTRFLIWRLNGTALPAEVLRAFQELAQRVQAVEDPAQPAVTVEGRSTVAMVNQIETDTGARATADDARSDYAYAWGRNEQGAFVTGIREIHATSFLKGEALWAKNVKARRVP